MRAITIAIALAILIPAAFGYTFSGSYELGYLAPLSHKIQFGETGTYFDYVADGGQDVLFPFSRYSLEFGWGDNALIFLYQPLRLETRELLAEDIVVDSLTFPAGTPMRFLYNFPFYRVSYLHDFADDPETELAAGISFQIRNATIEFESEDGELLRTNRNVGPVPILKFRGRKSLSDNFWIGSEIDGFYAPISYLNGDDNEVVGAILDGSLRLGLKLPENSDAFLNLRYIAGGADGTSDNDKGPGDGYTKNWLHFGSVSAGLIHTFSW